MLYNIRYEGYIVRTSESITVVIVALVVALQSDFRKVVGIVEMAVTACLHQVRPYHHIVVAGQEVERDFVVITL